MTKYLVLILLLSTNFVYAKEWSLHDLLEYALENSPVIKKSEIEADILSLDVKQAKQDHNLGFTIDVDTFSGFTFGRERLIVGGVVISDDVTNNNDFVDPFLVVQFRYPIFKDGKFIFQKSVSENIADLEMDNSLSKLDLDREALIFSIANLYLDLVQLNNKISYFQESLARLEKIQEEASARYDKKIITMPEYTEAEYKKNNKELEIKIALIDLEVYQKQFLNLLGMPLNEEKLDLNYDLNLYDEISLSVPGFNELKYKALEGSPELIIAENELELSELKSKKTKNKLLPDIFLRDTSVFTTNDNGHFLALGISFPLHNLFRRAIGDPEAERSKLDIEKNKINLSQIKEKLEFELFEDYSNWKKSIYGTESLRQNIIFEQARLDEATEKYSNRHFTTGEYLEQLDRFEKTRLEYNDQRKKELNTFLVLLKNSGLIEEYVFRGHPVNR